MGAQPAILDVAREYRAAGLSVIPVRADGTKAPADKDWRQFSLRLATDVELERGFGTGRRVGVGVAAGPASGHLVVLDFETAAAFDRWMLSLPPASVDLTRSCPLVRAPRGGAHLYVRLVESVPGTVLARHVVEGKPKTLIETRGEGHQVVAPGSPAECHPTGRLYEWERRGWLGGAPCTPLPLDEWFAWLEKAAALNEVELQRPDPPRPLRIFDPRPAGAGVRPGDDFNTRGTWAETGLFAAGWRWFQQIEPDRGFVTRPGKKTSEGKSGTVGLTNSQKSGHPFFFPFTSDCAPFESGKAYSRFDVYTVLKHGGDFSAAAKALAAAGYGDQSHAKTATAMAKPAAHSAPPAALNDPQSEATFDGAELVAFDPGASTGVKPPLPIIYYKDIEPALDAADFVEGLLIGGAMSVVYGESGAGKTFFVLDLALHVAAGLHWRGREVDRKGVLYLALEGAHGIKNRIAAFKLANQLNAVELPLAVVPVALDLLSPEADTLRVIEAAKVAAEKLGVPVGLIVVDTLSRAIAGGNENSSEDMGALVRHIDLIRQALLAHVLAVHHSGKDGAKGARGHSLLRAATDTEIEVSRDFAMKTSVAKVTKQRELELGDEFHFRLEPVELGINRRGKPVDSCVVRVVDADGLPPKEDRALQQQMANERKKRETERAMEEKVIEAVLRVVREVTTSGVAASLTEIRNGVGMRRGKIDDAITALLETGRLLKTGPFKKDSGNGALKDVDAGYLIPRTGDREWD